MFRPRQVSVRTPQSSSTQTGHKRKAGGYINVVANLPEASSKNQSDDTTPGVLSDVSTSNSVHGKPKAPDTKAEYGQQTSERDGDEDEVKQKSSQQRDPLDDEPKCVICGKYGEYVCNETDADVCSLECKTINLRNVKEKLTVTNDASKADQLKKSAENKNIIAQPSEIILISAENTNGDEIMDSSQISNLYKASYVYKQHETVSMLKPNQVSSLREKLGITDDTPPKKAKKPIYEFAHCHLNSTITNNLKRKNYDTPTPVQMQVIPHALCMEDLIVCSGTASGKTLSFLLPMIVHINAFNEACAATDIKINERANSSRPLGLIVAPTRELASQIEVETKVIAKGLYDIKTALLIGGVGLPPQLYRLKQNIQIVIATPGRLYDVLLLDESPLDLDFVQTVVIDEVDCILKMGFQSQVDKIWAYLKHDNLQTMMFSATIPEGVKVLARKLTRSPITVTVDASTQSSSNIKHVVLWVEENSKKKRLFQILDHQKHFDPPALIFVESKIGAEFLEEAINKMTSRVCLALHGDKNQRNRFDILKKLEDGDIEIIVTTGVLGRGVDLISVKQVIHFDVSKTLDEFIHRSGRAGRLGAHGTVISFLNNSNKEIFGDFYDYLKTFQVTLPPELEHSPFRRQRKPSNKSKRPGGKKRLNASDASWDSKSGSSLMSLLKARPR